ncbi:DgyrCDS6411 [Dimorphilus gyrociliatus]|uniref:Putative rRNA methyltransferase n=1 Tax=Dimorphilus gyrociliatus TaxID=2664684 RepID=A0A7I8VMZ3_9ANNE|nr:DgyrCDS6411 [Dimorphilus gyrociliatus]
MGKKGKIGKSRKDKFYHLAKETGYRARSAFKLLQLNRKYEFLEKSRVCIDLCAAPGGWLQVAAEKMPISSVIIGVDLVPIKPIRNVITLTEDITTEKCRQALKKEIQTWKADIVLHDGAPNVGKNWLHDAFSQATLTLQALKLALEFLKKGGYFVTKVFRSKDYNCLLWVFQQLFRKVFATKPAASRNESAEIFVVCQGFKAPDKIDPKFTDPKYVFQEVALLAKDSKKALQLMTSEKRKRSREGYADGDYTLHHSLSVNEFFEKENFLELLAGCHVLLLDNEKIRDHPLTTKEIKLCCSDIQVLGRRDVKNLLTWRKKLLEEFKTVDKKEAEVEEVSDADSEEDLDEKIARLKKEEEQSVKRKRKKDMKEKRKLRDKIDMKMVIPGDRMDNAEDEHIFDMKKITTKNQVKNITDNAEEPEVEDNWDDEEEHSKRKMMATYDRFKEDADETFPTSDEEENSEGDDDDDDDDDEEENGKDDDEGEQNGNPLIVDLHDEPEKDRNMAMWFNRDAFKDLENDVENDSEDEEDGIENGIVKQGITTANGGDNSDDDESSDDSDSDDDSDDSDSDYDVGNLGTPAQKKLKISKKDGFEVVPTSEIGENTLPGVSKKVKKLDPLGLAIGEELVKSKKRRRELIEESYHKFMNDDTDLPVWFTQDEARNYRKPVSVSKEQVQEYKEKLKAIDARPAKRVIEAKARKKKRSVRRLEKARKKAETVSESVDVSEKEKMRQIRDIYKRAGLLKKQKSEVSYVVAKKGAGKKVSRPAGVKGHFKVVDPRMKKDNRKMKDNLKKQKKGGKFGKKKPTKGKGKGR